MAIQYGNLGIVEKNLQLYYNREFVKSFRGEATSNIVTADYDDFENAVGSYSAVSCTATRTNELSYFGDYSLKVVRNSSGADGYLDMEGYINVLPSTSYTYSVYVYTATITQSIGILRPVYFTSANAYITEGTGGIITSSDLGKWKRVSYTFTTPNNCAKIVARLNVEGSSFYPLVYYVDGRQIEQKSYATPYTSAGIWTPNLVNTTSTNGNTIITRSAGADSWTYARVYSTQGYSVPCYVSFRASQTGCPIMVGLNSDPAAGINYSYLDYAWYPTWEVGNPAAIFESGNYIGSYGAYTTSTVFLIIYDGANVNYYKDGVLQRSVARASTSPLYLDSSFYSTANGGAINSLSFGPLSSMNRTGNYVIGKGGLLDLSGNGHSCDLTNSSIAFDSGGFYFNGNTFGALTVPAASSLLDPLSNNTHTYEVWFKLLGTPPGTYDGYFFGRQGFHEGFGHYKATPGTVFVITWYTDNTATGLAYTGSLNTWYHGVYVVDVESSSRKLYINGSLVGSGTLTKQLKQYASTTVYQLGAASPDYAGNCIVSSAKAYDRALNLDEILQNFNSQRKTYGV